MITASAREHRRAKCGDDPLVVVAHHRLLVVLEPGVGEAFTDPRRVGVHDLAEQEFGADSKHLDDHAGPCTIASRSEP